MYVLKRFSKQDACFSTFKYFGAVELKKNLRFFVTFSQNALLLTTP
jgi:hypothetical protein